DCGARGGAGGSRCAGGAVLVMKLAALKAFVARDFCWRCAEALPDTHLHVLDGEGVACACAACAKTARLVPPRFERLERSPVDDVVWASLGLPIGLACFVRSSAQGRLVAWYPGPAGATKSALAIELDLELEPDVEALIVDRLGSPAAYRVSVDACYA